MCATAGLCQKTTLGQGLQGRQLKKIPVNLSDQLARLWKQDTTDETLIRVLGAFGSQAALDRAVSVTRDSKVPESIRLSMLRILGDFGYAACVPELLNLIDDKQPEPIQVAVIEAMQRLASEQIGKGVLAKYPKMTESLQTRARTLLFSRSSWALPFLQELKQGKYQAKEVPMDEVRRLAVLQDEEVNVFVRGLWGNVQGSTSEEKLAEVRRFNNDLRAAKGNPVDGRVTFNKHCGKCHRLFGEGKSFEAALGREHRRTGPIGRQRQRHQPGKNLAPVGKLGRHGFGRELRLLPEREIGILHGERGQIRLPSFAGRGVERSHLVDQQTHRPAVADDVVHREQA